MSSPATGVEPVLVLPNHAPIVSSQLIGSLLNFFFFGTLLVQVYVYRICFPKDSVVAKSLVYFMLLAMAVCTCLNAADVQFWFGAGFGDIARFADPRNSRFYTPLMGSFIAMLVQLFFCYRIVAVRNTAWPLSLLIALIAMAQCAGGMGGGIMSYIAEDEVHDAKRTIFVHLWLIGGAVADILIAATMSALLFKASSIPATRDAVRSVVRLMIETNALSASVAIVGLVLFVGMPNTTYFVCPTMVLPGIYANTLLATLNNRAIARLAAAESGALEFAAEMQLGSNSAARAAVLPTVSYERSTNSTVTDSEKTAARGRSSTDSKWHAEPEVESDAEERV